jgi:segregation and condensation protein B
MNPQIQEHDVDDEGIAIPESETTLVALEDPTQQKRLIEALLFASPEPLSLRSIQNRLPDTADVGFLLTSLQAEYAERGVQLVQLEDSWAFRTAVDISPYLGLTKKLEKKLSRAALETLAIIAYHQPVTRAEVENIRGVATNKGTLDVLLEAGWIKPGKRRETPGRPLTWLTTTSFLDEFGISALNDLPGLSDLKAAGLLDSRPAIETIGGTGELFASANENEEGAGDDDTDEPLGEFDQADDDEDGELPEDSDADSDADYDDDDSDDDDDDDDDSDDDEDEED